MYEPPQTVRNLTFRKFVVTAMAWDSEATIYFKQEQENGLQEHPYFRANMTYHISTSKSSTMQYELWNIRALKRTIYVYCSHILGLQIYTTVKQLYPANTDWSVHNMQTFCGLPSEAQS